MDTKQILFIGIVMTIIAVISKIPALFYAGLICMAVLFGLQKTEKTAIGWIVPGLVFLYFIYLFVRMTYEVIFKGVGLALFMLPIVYPVVILVIIFSGRVAWKRFHEYRRKH